MRQDQLHCFRQRGIGLVEIMIALTISLVLTAGVIQFYLGSKQSYRLEDALSRVQETGRFAMSAISRDMRMADFWGCGARASLTLVNRLDSTDIPFHEAVDGTSNNGLNGSDTLVLRYAQSIGVNVLTHNLGSRSVTVDPSVSTTDVRVRAAGTTKYKDYVVLCNPVSADIFRVIDASDAGSISADTDDLFTMASSASGALATSYDTAAEFHVATQKAYVIENSDSGQPALFVRVNGGQRQEIVEGVENMQILYGEDTNGDRQADHYVEASPAVMDQVVSVRISLLARSFENNVTGEPQPIDYSPAPPADRRLRQVFTETLTLRNRVL